MKNCCYLKFSSITCYVTKLYDAFSLYHHLFNFFLLRIWFHFFEFHNYHLFISNILSFVKNGKDLLAVPQTLSQQEGNMNISGSSQRHLVMQKLMRKTEVNFLISVFSLEIKFQYFLVIFPITFDADCRVKYYFKSKQF